MSASASNLVHIPANPSGSGGWVLIAKKENRAGWPGSLQRRVEMRLHHNAAQADAGFARRVSQELLFNSGEDEGNIAGVSATLRPG
jgi:hypothetical protein